jgi:hypothetical protein
MATTAFKSSLSFDSANAFPLACYLSITQALVQCATISRVVKIAMMVRCRHIFFMAPPKAQRGPGLSQSLGPGRPLSHTGPHPEG